MSPRSRSPSFSLGLGLTLALGLSIQAKSTTASATAPPEGGDPTTDPAADPSAAPAPEVEPPPTWRFRKQDRPVKVMILAGSIGEWQREPYHEHLQNWCANIEVKNLSKTGLGAYQLRRRFMDQVVDNGYVNLRAPDTDYWLIFQGGLNSVAMPEKTNKEIRQLFLSAHQRGVEVVALSVTPWGDESDSKRWRGLAGLDYKRYSQTIVDFELGRLSPAQALGRYRSDRDQPDAPWDPNEQADVAVDLYDSPLRDHQAPQRDVAKMRAELERSKTWTKRLSELDDFNRALALDEQAQRAAELPRWYMRQELRSFDHIHPNELGHRLIAEATCPELPDSWGCSCPAPTAE